MAQQKNAKTILIQYLDWLNSIVSSNIAKREELMHCENVRSPMVWSIEKREGMSVVWTAAASAPFIATANLGLWFFSNWTNNKWLYRISTVGWVTSIYYLSNTDVWTALTWLWTTLTPDNFVSTCIAEGDLYIANQWITTRYVMGASGTTVIDSTTATWNLFNCPKANIINYYKWKLYVADYINWTPSVTYNNTVLMSSPQLWILALVNNDVASWQTVIPVTDNKYFQVGEILDFRRGVTAITTGTVASVQEATVTLSSPLWTALQASDEIWVNNTFSWKKVFRWVTNPTTMGVNVKSYDTFKISSTTDNDNETIKVMTNVGNVMLIATSNNIAIWNNFVLQNFDYWVGCCSKKGHVKTGWLMYFMHYTGVYSTDGWPAKYISAKVDTYIAGATKAWLDNCVASKKWRNIFFSIWDVTLKNPDWSIEKTLHDVCLEYSITQENWYLHTNWKINKAVTYISSTNPDRMVATSTFTDMPVVELLSDGKKLDVVSASAATSEIPFRADTPNILLSPNFQQISYPTEISLEMERGSGMKCFVSLDMWEWYEIEWEWIKWLTIFKVTGKDGDTTKPPRCRNIRLSFRHFGQQLCKISKFSITALMTPEEEVSKPDEK